ncbi:MAG: hypothetical protein SGPRY_013868, partial [Prymnesium sp.]
MSEDWMQQISIAADAPDPGGIPRFWPCVLRHWVRQRPVEGLELSGADWEVIQSLREIRVDPWEPDGALGE